LQAFALLVVCQIILGGNSIGSKLVFLLHLSTDKLLVIEKCEMRIKALTEINMGCFSLKINN
jgi:hypothetical protein